MGVGIDFPGPLFFLLFFPFSGFFRILHHSAIFFKTVAAQGLQCIDFFRFSTDTVQAHNPKVFSVLGDPEVMYAWEHGFSEQEAREWLAGTFTRYEKDGFGHYAAEVQETGEFVGMVGLLREMLAGKDLLGIGWMLRRDCWGHGYATEAAQAVLRDAFERLGAAEVIADIRPENVASIRVAERLGMRAEYEVVKRYRGKDMPHIVYVARSSANKMDIK